ncbi:MAG: hypothetical protein H6981_13520 [Gammaproteobacteria bacterium]|nr:hypothetical protein [Gammaproteobacteria bacterium]MCP5137809.1 hypothetical protein [Gammaproteobacteria bacterium]
MPRLIASHRSPATPLSGFLLILGIALSGNALATPTPNPATDIVSVSAESPLTDTDSLPGLDAGRMILPRIEEARSWIRSGVPQAAREPLQDARDRLADLNRDAINLLPADYHHDGDWWLPVRAEQLTVALDAPDMRARAPRNNSAPDTLTATAIRTDWLPLARTEQRVATALERIAGGEVGRRRALDQLDRATSEMRHTVTFDEPTLLNAYYVVESLLANSPNWPPSSHDDLRHAADALAATGSAHTELADALRELSRRPQLDWRGLDGIAVQLRRALSGPTTGDDTVSNAATGANTVPADVPENVPAAAPSVATQP